MSRTRLPDRRPSVTVPACWVAESGRHEFTLTVGFDLTGADVAFGHGPDSGAPAVGVAAGRMRIAEVFYADGQRSGSTMQHTVQDACVWASMLLQHGATPEDLRRSLGRVPGLAGDTPASPLGAIADALAGLAAEAAA